MSDHTWDESAAPAFDAATWVLERLSDTLQNLAFGKLSEHGEFEEAAEDVKELINDLGRLRDNCYNRREGDFQEYDEDGAKDPEEEAEVDVPKIMKEQGLKEVDGIHYKEEAYTGAKSGRMVQEEVDITDYLNSKESWEDVLERAKGCKTGFYPLLEKHGPTAIRLKLGRYAFLFYNPRTNLMASFILLDEVRGDRVGRPNRIVAEWRGLTFPGSSGVIRIYVDEAVVANADCSHFSQLIKLLEDIPPDFLAEEVHERWHPPRTFEELITEKQK